MFVNTAELSNWSVDDLEHQSVDRGQWSHERQTARSSGCLLHPNDDDDDDHDDDGDDDDDDDDDDDHDHDHDHDHDDHDDDDNDDDDDDDDDDHSAAVSTCLHRRRASGMCVGPFGVSSVKTPAK